MARQFTDFTILLAYTGFDQVLATMSVYYHHPEHGAFLLGLGLIMFVGLNLI
jgi:hypothetical protein